MYNKKQKAYLSTLRNVYFGSRYGVIYETAEQILSGGRKIIPKDSRGLTVENISSNVYRVHTTKVYGSGSGIYMVDHAPDFARLLNILGIKYEVGNDAPRGGKRGKYFDIELKGGAK